MIDAEEKNPDLIQGIAMSVMKDDGMLERLSRYEQRLELAIHRNLRQLEKLRKQSQSEKPDSGAPPVARCPFLPGVEYEHARRIMRERDANEENRAKESDHAPTADHEEPIVNNGESTTTNHTKDTKPLQRFHREPIAYNSPRENEPPGAEQIGRRQPPDGAC